MADSASGHRTVPHTADLRIEAWASTRNGCIKEAVLGTIETFLDTSLAYAKRTRRCRLVEERDEELLFAVLEEVIYLLDTEGEAPVDIDLHDLDGRRRRSLRDGRRNHAAAAGGYTKGVVPQ